MNVFFNHSFWHTHALLIARILMGGFFLMAGVQKLQGIDGVAAMISAGGFPAAGLLAWVVALFEVLAGAAIILGKYFRQAAILLALFTILVSFLFHGMNTWGADSFQQAMFVKNMAIAAGLLFMAAHGAGATWKLGK